MTDYYTIKVPVSRRLGPISPVVVRHDSGRTLHKHVQSLAMCFKRELHYPTIMFKAAEAPSDPWFEVWLFHAEAYDQRTEGDYEGDIAKMPRRVVGVVCFRQFDEKSESEWMLEWIWFHPYERGRSQLLASWPRFKERYGQFGLEGEVSPAMRGFFEKAERYCAKLDRTDLPTT